MKIICVLCVLILAFSGASGLAQTVVPVHKSIFFSVDKKKGIYRNFDEFRNNAPSVLYNGKVIDSGYPDIVFINFYEGKEHPCSNNTPIWGFCDGLTVFISETGKFRKKGKYTRLQYIGRYSYFQKEVYYTNASQMGTFSASRAFAYGINANTGEVFRLNKEVVSTILVNDEILTKKFESSRKNQEDVGIYFRLYSTNHPEEIK